jgi:hypothetical protein
MKAFFRFWFELQKIHWSFCVAMTRCCVTYFGPSQPCIESGLKAQVEDAPTWSPSTIGRPSFSTNSVAATLLGFCLVLVFHWETNIFIVTVTSSSFAANQGSYSCSSPLWRLVFLWSELEPHTCICFIHIRNFRLRAYTFLLVFFDSLAGLAFLVRSIKLCLVDN